MAVENMLAHGSFDSMSVLSICKEAGISSPTFYKHFSDKYHVAQWLFDRIAEQGLAQIGRTMTWEQAYYRHLTLLSQYRGVFEAFIRTPTGYQSLPSYGRRWQRENLHSALKELKGIKDDEELDFQINCLVQLETHSAVDWVKSCMTSPDTRTYSRYLSDVVPRRLYGLLNEPIDPIFG